MDALGTVALGELALGEELPAAAGSGAITGASSLTFTTTGALATEALIAGASTVTFTTSGTIDAGATNINGASTLTFTTSAAVQGGAQASGASPLTFATAGTLTGVNPVADLIGAIAFAFSASGTIPDEAPQRGGGGVRHIYRVARKVEQAEDEDATLEAAREAAEAARQASQEARQKREDASALASIEEAVFALGERLRAVEAHSAMEQRSLEAAMVAIVATMRQIEEFRRDEEEAEMLLLLAA